MKLDPAITIFGVIVLFRTVLPADGSETYHIAMEQPAPYYSPFMATIPAGSGIQWDNKTATAHTVTHEGCLTGKACVFDSGSVAPGKSFRLPLLEPGTYPYYCRLHPIMRGVITILTQELMEKR